MVFLMFKTVLLQSSTLIIKKNEFFKPLILPLACRLHTKKQQIENAIKKQQRQEKKNAKKLEAQVAEPEYVKTRSDTWTELRTKYLIELAKKESHQLKVALLDGKIVDGSTWKTTPLDVTKDIGGPLASEVYVAKVNNELWDLERPLETDCKIELLKFDDPEAQSVYWATAAFSLAEALEITYGVDDGGLICNIGSTKTGFFADIYLKDRTITNDDIDKIEKGIQKVLSLPRSKVERIEALKSDLNKLFAYNQFKLRAINEITNETIPTYRSGQFIDISFTPLTRHNKRVKYMKVLQVEAVQSSHTENSEPVQRVHGVVFPSEKEYMNFMIELKQFRPPQ